ncbi:PH domain-containing protein [Pseudalkalibacillus hwajinpoensis]|uniref:PH domain-containing protein n=1 Tax=Guptibacillus hwajinpoensis TaxID=208199 RepID=UPI001CD51C37|nr:PH domain-containing protein [Pseudalkalibacillus hwajinpoensis]MCA0989686.1 PH domain-containing protein [Pseudalkalibacillus hwajinpoensis]
MGYSRYSLWIIGFDSWKLGKSAIFFLVYFFLIKRGSESFFFVYGRPALLLLLGISVIRIVLKWFTNTYSLDNEAFHLKRGIFTKSKRTVPFNKIENTNEHTSFFHRLTGTTSIVFETGMKGDEAAVEFDIVSRTQANELKERVATNKDTEEADETVEVTEHKEQERQVHFRAKKKDLLKASFTSLSFLFLIPLLASFYFKLDDIFGVEEDAEGLVAFLLQSGWIMVTIIFLVILVSIGFGISRTFLKYGGFEIASDSDRIYIQKGVLDATKFSISKHRVQAIEIHQTMLKRILGLAEVKLMSVGEARSDEEKLESNSLYPFLPVHQAYEMIEAILPSYHVTKEMDRLPRASLFIRLMKPSFIWIIGTGVLWYFKPDVFAIPWWTLSVIILLIVSVIRYLDYKHTKYTLNASFVQFKTGGLSTSLFVTKRSKVIEISIKRGFVQKWFGVASVGIVNRSKPVHHSGIEDVPRELAGSFYQWYQGRGKEVERIGR